MNDNLIKVIVDCGTTKNVSGKYWMENFLNIAEQENKDKISCRKERDSSV